jgi:methionine aminopeptidase
MIGKLPHSASPTAGPSIKHALIERYRACVKAGVSAKKNGSRTCRIADILRRQTKK